MSGVDLGTVVLGSVSALTRWVVYPDLSGVGFLCYSVEVLAGKCVPVLSKTRETVSRCLFLSASHKWVL